MAQLLNTE